MPETPEHTQQSFETGRRLTVVANQLGHACVKTILDLYYHVSSGSQEAATHFDDIVIAKKFVTNL
jgi:sensor histidine kinase YesM